MALPCRRAVAACILIVCWSCQQCSGFLGSASLHSVRQAVSTTTPTASAFRKHDARKDRCYRPSSPSRATRMVAAPVELWDSYLHALDAAPLLTKVWTRTRIILPVQSILRMHVIRDSLQTHPNTQQGEPGLEDLHTAVPQDRPRMSVMFEPHCCCPATMLCRHSARGVRFTHRRLTTYSDRKKRYTALHRRECRLGC